MLRCLATIGWPVAVHTPCHECVRTVSSMRAAARDWEWSVTDGRSSRSMLCMEDMQSYPPHAFAPSGILWWELEFEPGTKRAFGDEKKIAAYLASTKKVGDVFTTRELREAIERDGEANTAEHFQRRIRALRSNRDGWRIASYQDDRRLPAEHYRIDKIGWHPGIGPRPKNVQAVSAKTRSLVLDRDGRRCVICGVGANEPYPETGSLAVMTIGHIVPQDRGGGNDIANLQVECAHCNETKRAEGAGPEAFDIVWPSVKRLPTAQAKRLSEWLAQGRRTRDRLDEVYDRVRMLPPDGRSRVEERLRKLLGD